MSWASRRRTTYLGGVILFFALIIGIPIARYFFSIKPTCFDGIQNQGETAVDEGGPCVKLNPADLSPATILWARSFKVRDGNYTAVAYVENANADAGVAQATYQFSLYDSNNVLIAERSGTTYILPGGITPVLETTIDTGNRIAVHTYFQFTNDTLDWQRIGSNPASLVQFSDQQVADVSGVPRITANVHNTSFSTLDSPKFVAVVFDSAGNAIAASQTALSTLPPSPAQQITFTWPEAFPTQVGRVDITALLPPVPASTPAR